MDYFEYCGRVVTKSCTTPISTIVYLADRLDEFKNCLYELKKSNPSIEYLYCVHIGENGDKSHIHLLLYSNAINGFKNCSKLRDYFILSDNDKSYAKNFIVTKSLGDAYKYLYHDKAYLDSKNETREFYYQENDVFGSDVLRELCLDNTYIESQIKSFNENNNTISQIVECLNQGMSRFEIVEKCTFNKSSIDYLASLNLIDKIEKVFYQEQKKSYENMVQSFHLFLLNSNSSYQTFNGSPEDTYCVLKDRDRFIQQILSQLATIDLIDFVFQNKITKL